jgi:hypothetical protein
MPQERLGTRHIRRFEGIWYRASPRPWRPFFNLTFEDTGVLSILDKSLTYHGRSKSLQIDNVRHVAYGFRGADFLNKWVEVTYGDDDAPSHALFKDGRWFGWRGILGGTRRLYREIGKLVQEK